MRNSSSTQVQCRMPNWLYDRLEALCIAHKHIKKDGTPIISRLVNESVAYRACGEEGVNRLKQEERHDDD